MGFDIHLPTLMVVAVGLNLLLAVLMWAVYRLRTGQHCFLFWSLACLTFAAGSLTGSLRLWLDWPSLTVLASHLLLGASPWLVLSGLYRFSGLPWWGSEPVWRLFAVAGVLYLLALLVSFQADPLIAAFLTAAFTAGGFVISCHLLGRLERAHRLPVRLLQVMFLMHAFLMAVQVVLIARFWLGEGALGVDGPLRAILINHTLLATGTVLVLPLLAYTASEATLKREAAYDELTGLLNRREFFTRAQLLFGQASAEQRPLAMLMMDLDHFKMINDQWGHALGDEALKFTAGLLVGELREEDIVGRIGGEEFAIMLPDTSVLQAQLISQRLCARLAEEGRTVARWPLNLSASFGGAQLGEHHGSLAQLLDQADQALLQAKRAGRNQVHFEAHGKARVSAPLS